VKNPVSKFAFKWVNLLYRYVKAYNRLGVLLSNGGDFKGRLKCHEV
jgi:hypothetical protein